MPISGDHTVGNFATIRLDDYRSTVKYNQYYQGHPDVDVVEHGIAWRKIFINEEIRFFRRISHMDLCILLDHSRSSISSDGDFSSSRLEPSLLMSEQNRGQPTTHQAIVSPGKADIALCIPIAFLTDLMPLF